MAKQMTDIVTGDKIVIVTDGKWKTFKFGCKVPKKIRINDFEWLSEDEGIDGFICYLGRWYHLSEFIQIDDKASPLYADGWRGVYNDSCSSGVVIKVASDGESYQIGKIFS